MPVLRQSFFRQGRFDNPFAKSYRRQAFQVSHLSQGIFPPISSHTPRAWNSRRVEVVSMSALFPWLYRQSPTTFSFQECPFRTRTDARCLSHGWLNKMTFIILLRSNPTYKRDTATLKQDWKSFQSMKRQENHMMRILVAVWITTAYQYDWSDKVGQTKLWNDV